MNDSIVTRVCSPRATARTERKSYEAQVQRLRKLQTQHEGSFLLDAPPSEHLSRPLTWLTLVVYEAPVAEAIIQSWLEEWREYGLDITAQLTADQDAWVLTLTARGPFASPPQAVAA
jgi:hypothetical protein